ncbi:hypothetical protein T492DRAFT_1078469 [Pavlovales sp. CCMP2436]|nr:hypothetical protein T492DRAFT_1078469 [Pavlovales sp. CCMP2436]
MRQSGWPKGKDAFYAPIDAGVGESRGIRRGWPLAKAAVIVACLIFCALAARWLLTPQPLGTVNAHGRHRYPADCPLTLTVWSRGLMRSCCDLWPEKFVTVLKHGGGQAYGEHGDIDWASAPIRNGSILYVPSLDMPSFVRRFVAFPPSARVTVVSGAEDIGQPRELWGLGPRRDQSVPMAIGLDAFLLDLRLLHWWVQNYDMVGCNLFSACSPTLPDSAMARKVSPIPIGLDFHTLAEKRSPNISACKQQAELESVRGQLPSFAKRPDALLAPFACRTNRRDACMALLPTGKPPVATFFHGSRTNMWHAMGQHAFVASPIGHGVDTHRLWEVLALGSVPVAISSPLDGLYAEFPVIVIRAWTDANASAIPGWRAEIERRFGSEPFSAQMIHRVSSEHWADRIAAQHEAALGPPLPQPLLPTVKRRRV